MYYVVISFHVGWFPDPGLGKAGVAGFENTGFGIIVQHLVQYDQVLSLQVVKIMKRDSIDDEPYDCFPSNDLR